MVSANRHCKVLRLHYLTVNRRFKALDKLRCVTASPDPNAIVCVSRILSPVVASTAAHSRKWMACEDLKKQNWFRLWTV